MSGYGGVLKIVRFNWPWYAGAVLVTAATVGAVMTWTLAAPWATLAWALVAIADTWLLLSLVVSHIIYDRSAVARGGWMDGETAAEVAIVHLGQDEASAHAARMLPTAHRRTFDVFDPTRSGSPSLRRARALAEPSATAAALNQLPLADGSIDLALVIFAAHEIRHDATRAVFFRELARIVSPTGRVLVVEHLRDGWNLLAYGPGAFHFLARRTWLRTFALAGLRVARETSLTPWVRRFELRSGLENHQQPIEQETQRRGDQRRRREETRQASDSPPSSPPPESASPRLLFCLLPLGFQQGHSRNFPRRA